MSDWERRHFLGLAIAATAPIRWSLTATPTRGAQGGSDQFPRQPPPMVEEMLRVSHGNLARVRSLLDLHPALAKAAIDWGFGDWEDALGAASHVGRPDIAELLLQHGARPTLFSAAMLGQLDVVQALITAQPGAQRIRGPHSLSLLHHARAGGDRAKAVRGFLEQLGDADGPVPPPLPVGTVAACIGSYRYATGVTDRFDVASTQSGGLSIFRAGLPFPRDLIHLGDLAFHPIGAESLRIRFEPGTGGAGRLLMFDPDLVLTAQRVV